MRLKNLAAGFTILFFVSSISVKAETYFGIGFGDSSFDLTDFGLFELEDSQAFSFFLGHRDGNTGSELEFSFAEYDWERTGGDAAHNASHLAFFGIYYVPMSESLDFYGKAGLNFWSTDVDLLGVNFEGDDGFGIAYGLGLDISASENLKLRLEYEVFPGLEDGVDEGDVDQVMLNIAFIY